VDAVADTKNQPLEVGTVSGYEARDQTRPGNEVKELFIPLTFGLDMGISSKPLAVFKSLRGMRGANRDQATATL